MKGKIMGTALAFFTTALLLYLGVQLLLKIWWILVLLTVIVLAAIVIFHVRRNRHRW